MRKTAYVESEPGPGGTQQNFSVLPLTEVVAEICPAGLGNIDLVGDDAVIGTGLDTLVGTLDVLDSLFHVTFNVESETRGLGDGETEVESDNSGNAAETDKETPAVVNGFWCSSGLREDGILVGGDDDKGDESSTWKDTW